MNYIWIIVILLYLIFEHLIAQNIGRKEAILLYQKAINAYPGFPVQHDNWNIVIDKTWIEERIKVPFKGVK